MRLFSKIKSHFSAFIRYSVGYDINDIKRSIYIDVIKSLAYQPGCMGVDDSHFEKPLIVSLTSYGERVNDVHLAIESIMQQTLKPSRIILWLAEDEFKDRSVPLSLQHMTKRGLEIRFCPDWRSYKKLVPTLMLCPDADIVTIDDDIIFPIDMLERLWNLHKKFPEDIIAMRAQRIGYEPDGSLKPYMQWEHEISDCRSFDILPTGGAGLLYPANCMHSDVVNPELFMQLAPTADDLWFRAMTQLTGRNVAVAKDFSWTTFVCIDGGNGLFSSCNYFANDIQLKNIQRHYHDVFHCCK